MEATPLKARKIIETYTDNGKVARIVELLDGRRIKTHRPVEVVR